MPLLPPSQSVYTRTDALAFLFLSTGGWLLQWAFIIGIVLGLGRLGVIGSLAFAQWLRSLRRDRQHSGEQYEPFVSIIVPAFNQDRAIKATMPTLLNSAYATFQITCVDHASQP